jgi:hypothetical protein
MTLSTDCMAMHRHRFVPACVVLALALAAGCARADEDPCAGFSWNIAHERTLFASAPQSIVAGREPTSAPPLSPERLFQLQLTPQDQVVMLLASGKKTPGDGAFAGLARLQTLPPGNYRVSMDQAAWVEVVADGHLLSPTDFQGRPRCAAPHKIVQYLLPAARELVLQFSAAAARELRVTITRVH